MANKGNSRHIKSLASPGYFSIHRKEGGRYVVKPAPGRHSVEKSVALALFVKKVGVAKTTSEATAVIKGGGVIVNGKVIKETKYPIGMNDHLALTAENKLYEAGINGRGQVSFEEVKGGSPTQQYKVVGKYKSKGDSMMIRLHDGRVMKSAKGVERNDSVVVDKAMAIKEVLKMKESAKCIVIDGVHVGTRGKVVEIRAGNMHKGAAAVIESAPGEKFETLVRNLMVIG